MPKSDSHGNLPLLGAGLGIALAAGASLRRTTRFSWRSKLVLVAGGSRGLGLVIARQLAAMGARIAILARSESELNQAHQELESSGAQVITVPCDLRLQGEVEAAVQHIEEEMGAIDVLVNCAGTILVGPVETLTLRDMRHVMESNFWSAVHTCFVVLPGMRRRGRGRIVNISSIGGKVAVPHLLPYTASKFALTGFSRGLRTEVQQDGVVVTTICPGLMRTGSPRHARFKGQNQKEYAWFSIADSTPGLSTSAEQAASKILDAAARGEVERIITWPAKLATFLDQILPGISGRVMETAATLLPDAGEGGKTAVPGAQSHSSLSPSKWTALSDRAAASNNEMVETPR